MWTIWKGKKDILQEQKLTPLDKPIRVFSCPLNQDTSAAGLACTLHLITADPPSSAY